ncbi:hypothetical protein EDB80DRAFT_690367 [Ilyonectria destructans]|nr:hypothetical protein EDB80DRAFT_690367 [Ilyonectria destructans]
MAEDSATRAHVGDGDPVAALPSGPLLQALRGKRPPLAATGEASVAPGNASARTTPDCSRERIEGLPARRLKAYPLETKSEAKEGWWICEIYDHDTIPVKLNLALALSAARKETVNYVPTTYPPFLSRTTKQAVATAPSAAQFIHGTPYSISGNSDINDSVHSLTNTKAQQWGSFGVAIVFAVSGTHGPCVPAEDKVVLVVGQHIRSLEGGWVIAVHLTEPDVVVILAETMAWVDLGDRRDRNARLEDARLRKPG